MKLYYTTTEVARMLNVNASHLRFLESQFPELKPDTNARGVRHYKQDDIDLLRRIIHLTKECGYTLEGARQQLLASRQQQAQGQPSTLDSRLAIIDSLTEIRRFLTNLKDQL